MYGRHKPQGKTGSLHLQVQKIFHTIQGEGPFSGVPAVFVRLTGCNLACWFCDTDWDDENDPKMTVDEVLLEIDRERELYPKTTLCVITGGEPLRFDIVALLATTLTARDWTIQFETAGTFYQPVLQLPGIHTVVSPKTGRVDARFAFISADRVSWKYVIRADETDPKDGLPVGNYQRHKKDVHLTGSMVDDTKRLGGALYRPPEGHRIYVTPMDENPPTRNAANRIEVAEVAMKFGYIAQIQIHKELELE